MPPFDPERRSHLTRAASPETLELERSVVEWRVDRADSNEGELASYRAGDVLNGRYSILEEIGAGGMGRVYRVRDALHPERALALKTVAPSFVDPARIDLLKAEFRTMSALDHPNVARVYDFEAIESTSIQSTHCFTMEYVAGRDLVRSSEGAPVPRIIDWIVQVCRALQLLHSRAIVHADLKPHNAIVTPTNEVKVLDFGLSGARGGWLIGTPGYMAPELFRGAPPSPQSDLYALGVTLHRLLFRRLPFEGDSLAALAGAREQASLSFPGDSSIDESLCRFIARACARDPADRFSGAGEMIEALSRATGRSHAIETADTRRSYVTAAPLIGRDEERERLIAFCLGGGEATLATVAGPSGIGKSRLLDEVRRQLQLVGAPCIEASCYEGSFDELEPLRRATDAARALCASRGLDAIAMKYTTVFDWLASRSGDRSIGLATVTEDESRRMSRLRQLAEFFVELSGRVAHCLCIHDAQWARAATTDFLAALCERRAIQREAGQSARLSLIVSYRDDEVARTPLEDVLSSIAESMRVRIELRPLSLQATEQLIGAMLGVRLVPASFSERLLRETGGNPFFLSELMRALMERGDVYREGDRWAARAEVAELDVPSTIAAVLERRLGAINPEERELLTWLSIHGQPMPLSILLAITSESEGAIRAKARRLVERQLARFIGDDRLEPAHDKLREYVYERIDSAERRRRHREIADALDRHVGPSSVGGEEGANDEGAYLFERAHHRWHAGDEERARAFAAAAAALGERTFAIDAAIDNYQRLAITAERRGEERERRRAIDKVLELCTITGQYGRMLSIAEAEVARRSEAIERARLYQLQGEALGGRGELREGIERLRRATALLGGAVPRGKGARRLFIGWHLARHSLSLSSKEEDWLQTKTMDELERRKREILARCYQLLSIYFVLGGDDEGFGVAFAGLRAARPLGAGEHLLRALLNASFCHHALGQYRASERTLRAARHLARTEIDRAHLLTIEVLCRLSTQHPAHFDQLPVQAHEQEIVRAIELLSVRSKALYAHLARTVATNIVLIYAPRFRFRPEVFRWAEAMRGTVHYGFVQGGAAVMCLIDGQRERAAEAYAQARRGEATPFYRAFVDGNYGYRAALLGDVPQGLRSLRSAHEGMRAIATRVTSSLWVPAVCICAALAIDKASRRNQEQRKPPTDEWRDCIEESVARLERAGRELPANLRLVCEAGRMALGRSSETALERAKAISLASWREERSIMGHLDGCLAGAFALARTDEGRALAHRWASETLVEIEARFPNEYAARVRELFVD